jgi:hypothetical protein
MTQDPSRGYPQFALKPTPRRGRHPLVYGAGFFLMMSLVIFLAGFGMVWILTAVSLAIVLAISALVIALRGSRASV